MYFDIKDKVSLSTQILPLRSSFISVTMATDKTGQRVIQKDFK